MYIMYKKFFLKHNFLICWGNLLRLFSTSLNKIFVSDVFYHMSENRYTIYLYHFVSMLFTIFHYV